MRPCVCLLPLVRFDVWCVWLGLLAIFRVGVQRAWLAVSRIDIRIRDHHCWFVGSSFVTYPLASCFPYRSCFTYAFTGVRRVYVFVFVCAFFASFLLLRVCTAAFVQLVGIGSLALLSLFQCHSVFVPRWGCGRAGGR